MSEEDREKKEWLNTMEKHLVDNPWVGELLEPTKPEQCMRLKENGFLEFFDPGDEQDMQQAKELAQLTPTGFWFPGGDGFKNKCEKWQDKHNPEMFVHEEIGVAKYNPEALAKVEMPCESSSTPLTSYLRAQCREDGFARRIMPPEPMGSCCSSSATYVGGLEAYGSGTVNGCCSSSMPDIREYPDDTLRLHATEPLKVMSLLMEPFNITFHNDNKEVGKLFYNTDKKKLEFEGDAEYSALTFFEYIKDELERYLKEREE